MDPFSDSVKETLISIVRSMSEAPDPFVKAPGKDFTRNRKLPFETVVRMLITMGGNSICKELLEAHVYDPYTATTSAFIQQRDNVNEQIKTSSSITLKGQKFGLSNQIIGDFYQETIIFNRIKIAATIKKPPFPREADGSRQQFTQESTFQYASDKRSTASIITSTLLSATA